MRVSGLRLLVVLVMAIAGPVIAQEKGAPKTADALLQIKELPNPFVFSDGSLVRSKEDWPRRREELKQLFQDYEYGHLPPKPEKMEITRGESVMDEAAGAARQDLELHLEHGGKKLVIHVRLTIPQTDAKRLSNSTFVISRPPPSPPAPLPQAGEGSDRWTAAQKVPVVVRGGFFFGGFGRRGAGALGPGRFGPGKIGPNLFQTRGYAIAEFDFQEVALDNRDRARTAGVYQLFGPDIDCGGLMAWAWGIHRVIDALETVDRIDCTKIVVTGHSRYGKAALVAGAFDERIALSVPSHSGCAGTAPYRFIYGKSEQLHNIVGFALHWFRPDFNQFVGKVERLPVDQHLLRALVAPRGLLSTEGTEDAWTNPQGSQLTYLAAKQVYDFLGAGDRLSIRYRPVGHIPSDEDMLDFADHVFFGKPLPAEFGKLPYPEDEKAFTWRAPQ